MTEYIKREDAIKAVCDCVPHSCDIATCGNGCAEAEALSKLPAEDVRPVVRSQWCWSHDKEWGGGGKNECCACHFAYADRLRIGGFTFNFCPNCGADMRGGGGNE